VKTVEAGGRGGRELLLGGSAGLTDVPMHFHVIQFMRYM
jgi:hypothetical protein